MGIVADKYCKGCEYYTQIYAELWYCAYIFKEDKVRPCDPGKGCTVKKKKRKSKEKESKDVKD
jgi:hypothetical protein